MSELKELEAGSMRGVAWSIQTDVNMTADSNRIMKKKARSSQRRVNPIA